MSQQTFHIIMRIIILFQQCLVLHIMDALPLDVLPLLLSISQFICLKINLTTFCNLYTQTCYQSHKNSSALRNYVKLSLSIIHTMAWQKHFNTTLLCKLAITNHACFAYMLLIISVRQFSSVVPRDHWEVNLGMCGKPELNFLKGRSFGLIE